MKYVAIVENVNQKKNKKMIGQLVLLDPEIVLAADGEWCYGELDSGFEREQFESWWDGTILHLNFGWRLHSIANVEIIGVL